MWIMASSENTPIACTLGTGEHKQRLASIAALNQEALLNHTRHDLDLHLIYAADAAHRVRQMVREEKECCSFLSFDLDQGTEEIRLTITLPERARDAADDIFGQFIPSGKAHQNHHCC
jgi:hypothetical protein